MDAAINSETPVTDYLNMPVMRFWDTWQAICAVHERRAKQMNEARSNKGAPKPRKARRHRR